jgi:hypothetical protein
VPPVHAVTAIEGLGKVPSDHVAASMLYPARIDDNAAQIAGHALC